MPFTPQSIDWPGTRAVLLVHGIGNASTGEDGAFPLDALHAALGDRADDIAIYHLNYDFINDWAATKVDFAAALATLKARIGEKLAGASDADTLADYIGDILWPVLSANIRFAVRDAFVAQLTQMQIDRTEAAIARDSDPLDYGITIIAHSLGCFHTYEALWAVSTTPTYQLMPRSDLFTLEAVVLMASPVQLIRSCADAIRLLVPDVESLACVSKPLGIPSEHHGAKSARCTDRFISVTGNHDPVGGWLGGKMISWAYMDVPGQESVVAPQRVLTLGTRNERLSLALALATHDDNDGLPVNDPHSWAAYIANNAALLRGATA